MSLPHWLDDVIALVKREGERWAGGNPEKAGQHETAVALLSRVRESGASHEETRTFLNSESDEVAPHVVPATPADAPSDAPSDPADAPPPDTEPVPAPTETPPPSDPVSGAN